MDASDRALLDGTVRDAIIDGSVGSGGVDKVLSELGWLDMLETETRDAIDIVFTALGATNNTASVLDDVIANALGMQPTPELAVALPRFGTWACPGQIVAGEMHAVGLATARATTATQLLLVCERDGKTERLVVPMTAADLTPVRGIDPDAGLHAVRVDHDAADATPIDEAAWEAAIAAGRRAIAHQLAGASRTMLELARTHAMERVQFGRPVARFQAVRHRLAEALVAIEALDATLAAAWDVPGALTAALAKAAAGRAARTVAAHCQQVLAGIGFTTDHPFHTYLKRTMALEGLFGSADEIVVDVGRELLAARSVPTLIEL